MPSIEFSQITPAEVDLIAAMEAGSGPWPWSRNNLQHSVEAGHSCIVCNVSGRTDPVGYAVVQTVLDESSLLNLCVAADSQRQGIAQALLRFVLDQALAQGAVSVWLEVRTGNAGARRLYEREGFVLQGVRKAYYPNGKDREDACIYSLSLSSPG